MQTHTAHVVCVAQRSASSQEMGAKITADDEIGQSQSIERGTHFKLIFYTHEKKLITHMLTGRPNEHSRTS